MNKEIKEILDSIDNDYGDDLSECLGPNWKEILKSHLESAWYFGYTTGMADSAKISDKLKERRMR